MNQVTELTEEQAAKALDGTDAEAEEALDEALGALPDPEDDATGDDRNDASGPPAWAVIPKDLKMPKTGTMVHFIRIPAKYCANPADGDRQCVCWALTENEENVAFARARGDNHRAIAEMAKQMVRAIDGKRASWDPATKDPETKVARFWGAIGPKGRGILRTLYLQTHQVTNEEILDFFSNHFVSTTALAG